MDAQVNRASSSHGGTQPGRIIVVRHGKPALDRDVGPRLDWQSYRDWWAQYEAGSLFPGQECPPSLVREAEGQVQFFSSMRPRAIESAAKIAQGRKIVSLPVFNEAPLPPPRWPSSFRFLPRAWNRFARVSWLLGNANGEESVEETRRRAGAAADVLIEAANRGEPVLLAAHGWFNRMLRRPLTRRGWACVRDGGDSYWSFRVYEKRGP